MADAESLMRAHDAFDLIEEQFNEALDESLSRRQVRHGADRGCKLAASWLQGLA